MGPEDFPLSYRVGDRKFYSDLQCETGNKAADPVPSGFESHCHPRGCGYGIAFHKLCPWENH